MADIEENIQLKFITTSDIHGAIFQYDFIEDEITSSSLAQIFTYITEQRQTPDQEIILLDNGDILQGQPIVFYSNLFYSKNNDFNHICSQVMNYMQYDTATIGNHDIEAGHEVYDKLREDFNFPWLAANAIDIETGEPYFEPYTIIHRKGLKIAVLGLITPAIPMWLPESKWQGIEFEDMIETAKKWVPYIKETEKPDLLVGLFHAGIDYTYNRQSPTTHRNENASILVAQQVPGFDIIFAGHDHQENNLLFEDIEGNEVLLLNPKSLANFVSIATVEMRFNRETNKYEKYDITGINLQMNFCDTNSEFKAKFEKQINTVKKYVSEPIGSFTRSISSRESLFADTGFVDLIHRIQLDYTQADISFAAPLSFDSVIRKGTIYVRDMFKLYKFDNLLYTIWLTGREIKDYLEFSYGLWFSTMKNINHTLLNFKQNHKGELVMAEKYYNFSSAAGIIYTVDLKALYGQKIEIQSMASGEAFDFTKRYKVALNSYRGNGGGGHLIEGSGISHVELHNRIITKSEKDVRSILMEWIKEKGEITPNALGQWRAIPVSWWHKGRQKSLKILFNMKKN
ncbi:MAG: bifunctional metallophosphatase/5'-nucleotidase [Bacteroidales bacterium]|nr:bifunctional metallophosphatase/5'-nucleotidase [Bacteroidales bacterium]